MVYLCSSRSPTLPTTRDASPTLSCLVVHAPAPCLLRQHLHCRDQQLCYAPTTPMSQTISRSRRGVSPLTARCFPLLHSLAACLATATVPPPASLLPRRRSTHPPPTRSSTGLSCQRRLLLCGASPSSARHSHRSCCLMPTAHAPLLTQEPSLSFHECCLRSQPAASPFLAAGSAIASPALAASTD